MGYIYPVFDDTSMSALIDALKILHFEFLEEKISLSDMETAAGKLLSGHPDALSFFFDILHGHNAFDEISEDEMILAGLDISISRHLNYMPAYTHSHKYIEVLCVIEGKCTNIVGGNALEMRTGDICIISPQTEHSVSMFDDTSHALNLLIRSTTFDNAFLGLLSGKDLLSQFFGDILGKAGHQYSLYIDTGGNAALTEIAHDMHEEYENGGDFSHQVVNSLFQLMMAKALNLFQSSMTFIGETKVDKNILKILGYMQKNYRSATLSDVADEFGYSYAHLSRLLKKQTGSSFAEIIRETKLKQAEKLLALTGIPVQMIAESVGYSSISYFERAFREKHGMTPRDYRGISNEGDTTE